MCSQVTDLKNHPRERITFFSVADSISSENGRAHFRFRSAICFPGEKKFVRSFEVEDDDKCDEGTSKSNGNVYF